MNIFLIVGFLIFAIIIFLIFKLAKSLVRAFFFVTSIVLFGVMIFSFFLISDIDKFKDGFQNEPNIYLLEDQGIVAGFVAEGTNLEAFDDSRLKSINDIYAASDYEGIKGESFKLIIIKDEVFDNISLIEIANINITRDQYLKLLGEDSLGKLRGMLLDAQYTNTSITEFFEDNFKDDSQLRARVFMGLIAMKTDSEGPGFLIYEFKASRVMFYPETLLFKTLYYMPQSFIKKLGVVK